VAASGKYEKNPCRNVGMELSNRRLSDGEERQQKKLCQQVVNFSYLWVVEVKFLFDIFPLQLLLAVEKYRQPIG